MEKGRGKGTDTLQTDEVITRKEYIEREAALAFMNEVEPCICHNSDGVVFTATKDSDMLDYLRSIPAADVVPVRHGRWVTKKDACGRDYTICSACETEIQWRDRRGLMLIVDMQNAPYCPNCGARMDGDSDGV